MEIICDTNIWYHFTDYPPTSEMLEKHVFVATFNSIDELARKPSLLNDWEKCRNAIISIFKYSSLKIFEPPLNYLMIKSDESYKFDIISKCKTILQLTEYIANNDKPDSSEFQSTYISYSEKRAENLRVGAEFFNNEAKKIIGKIKDKKAHRSIDTYAINRRLISLFISSQNESKELPTEFDWSNIELFEKVIKVFFNDMELGAIKIQPNDFYDLFLLLYVDKRRKIWTKEERWKRLIKRAHCEEYLYET